MPDVAVTDMDGELTPSAKGSSDLTLINCGIPIVARAAKKTRN